MTNQWGFGNLLTQGYQSPKTLKSDNAGLGYKTVIMYFAPQKESGLGNVCSSATAGCVGGCLFKAGRGRMSNVQKSRLNRTKLWFNDRVSFIDLLFKELGMFSDSLKDGEKGAVRLNGTSDIMWERLVPSLFTTFPQFTFYDYTKHYRRMLRFCDGELPDNYHLTFSRSECNHTQCHIVLIKGGNVAVVFSKDIPKYYLGKLTYNMDKTDLRFLDPKNQVGYLKAKGPAKKDRSGFVVNYDARTSWFN